LKKFIRTDRFISWGDISLNAVNIRQIPRLARHSTTRARWDARRDHGFEQPI